MLTANVTDFLRANCKLRYLRSSVFAASDKPAQRQQHKDTVQFRGTQVPPREALQVPLNPGKAFSLASPS